MDSLKPRKDSYDSYPNMLTAHETGDDNKSYLA